MATALRIEIYDGAAYGSPLDFDEEEVLDLKLKYPKTHTLLYSKEQAPFVYDATKSWIDSASEADPDRRLIITARIRHFYQTTKTDTDLIAAAAYKMKVYYKYQINAATNAVCVVDPSYRVSYYWGQQAAMIVTSFTFYRCE